MFTSDVHVAIDGFFAAGADKVLVNEAHATMRNLLLEELDHRAVMLTGRHKELSMVEGIEDPEVGAVAFISYHAAAGAEGVLAHTYLANSITSVRVNGELGSEGRLMRTWQPSTGFRWCWRPAMTERARTQRVTRRKP